jgi:hypothetical protein
MLRNMVINLSKESSSVASNHIISTNSIQVGITQEFAMHQMLEDMDLDA